MKSGKQYSSFFYNYFCDLVSAVLRLALVSVHIPQSPVSVIRVQSPVLSPVSRSDMSHQAQVRGRGRQTVTTSVRAERGERNIWPCPHSTFILCLGEARAGPSEQGRGLG